MNKLINGTLQKIRPEDTRQCEICERETACAVHHVYFGKNRKQSEKYGMLAFLCPACHDDLHGHVTVIFGNDFDQLLKSKYQQLFMECWTKDQFVDAFGINYLEVNYD